MMTLVLSAFAIFASASSVPTAREITPACVALRAEEPTVASQKESPPPVPPVPAPGGAPRANDPAIDSLPRGTLPADADLAAKEAWQRTLQSQQAAGNAAGTQRVTAFDLQLEVRHRSADNQTNDSPSPLRYRYLDPGFVRVTTASKREHVRGPRGDFLIDPERHEVIPLVPSRENEQDIRQLNESVGIARNFIALTDPAALRIAGLKLLPGAPTALPQTVKDRFAKAPLQWLEVRTPDFHLIASIDRTAPPPPSLVRVAIGADAKSGEVELALVDVDGPATAPTAAAVLIELANYTAIDGFRMPQLIKVYRIDEKSAARSFGAEPTTMLGIVTRSASLRAPLKREDFLPG
jgi:hypothetical protein